MNQTPKQIITDDEIERVHGYANFGGTPKREVVNTALMKCACGYHNGSTAQYIIAEHGLIRDRNKRGQFALTQRGRKYLYAVWKELEKDSGTLNLEWMACYHIPLSISKDEDNNWCVCDESRNTSAVIVSDGCANQALAIARQNYINS